MKIFSAEQIKQADLFTQAHEPVEGIELMERAARECSSWIKKKYPFKSPIYIFCGMGNNGGDGLALARLLFQEGYPIHPYIIFHRAEFSIESQINKNRLEQLMGIPIEVIHSPEDFPSPIPVQAILADALLGTGLRRPVEGLLKVVIEKMNEANRIIISLDMPSGLFADQSSIYNTVIQANHTLSFELFKMAFLFAENSHFTGDVHLLTIGIHPDFLKNTNTPFHLTDAPLIASIYKKRSPFANKGNFGHALLIAGSQGKMGAAVLSASGCLRSGVGLLTCYIPEVGYDIIQTSVPEAMCRVYKPDESDPLPQFKSLLPLKGKYKSIGIGPGIGTHSQMIQLLEFILSEYSQPMVLDADALNIISLHPKLFEKIPPYSILSPHPKEFERLFGSTQDDFQRLTLLSNKAIQYQICIILKGKYSAVALPDGSCYFNTTGNPGMATGGSGDVLTGILTSLLCQNYSPSHSAILGVYLHGKAGDLAASRGSEESLIASDIPKNLRGAFKHINN
ncbi:MAG: NAD(P)H-hydrate dehydratase [Chitinophagaceae bacterium]